MNFGYNLQSSYTMLELRTVNKLSIQNISRIVTDLKQNYSYIFLPSKTGKSGLQFMTLLVGCDGSVCGETQTVRSLLLYS